MQIADFNVRLDLNKSEISDITYALMHDLKVSSEHYINHYKGETEEGFIEYVEQENKQKLNLFLSFSGLGDSRFLSKELHYHFKKTFENKKKA